MGGSNAKLQSCYKCAESGLDIGSPQAADDAGATEIRKPLWEFQEEVMDMTELQALRSVIHFMYSEASIPSLVSTEIQI